MYCTSMGTPRTQPRMRVFALVILIVALASGLSVFRAPGSASPGHSIEARQCVSSLNCDATCPSPDFHSGRGVSHSLQAYESLNFHGGCIDGHAIISRAQPPPSTPSCLSPMCLHCIIARSPQHLLGPKISLSRSWFCVRSSQVSFARQSCIRPPPFSV